jgi:hypothetical protein
MYHKNIVLSAPRLTIGIGHRPSIQESTTHIDAGVAVGITLGVEVMIIIIVLGIIYVKKKGAISNYKRYLVFHNPSGAGAEDAERL